MAETPEEFLKAIPQYEVDKDIKEMTCGPKLAERFWPIRYQLSNRKKNLYENTIHTLIARARRERRPDILSSLTSELTFDRAESSRLPSFLDESWARYERLRKIASEMGATDLPCFREAVWEDRLTIILVFYEVLTSKRDSEDILKLRGAGAQFMLDLMQDAIQAHINLSDLLRGSSPRIRGSRKDFLQNALEQGLLRNVDRAAAHFDARRLIVQLSELSDLLPSSLVIHGVKNSRPTPFSGTFGDVFTADHQGKIVALKRLRIFSAENEENPTQQKFCREALIWKNLDHDHVLPFIGVDLETFPGYICMLSPWMANGALVTFKGGPSEATIPVLIHEIAVGLQYLHSQSIVHGDLRGANILLDDQGHARLADFGLSTFADGPLVPTKRGGSLRWMAPELIDPESCELVSFQRTFASDIYSFGCVCLELYTGKPPFSEIPSEGAVLLKVIKGLTVPSSLPRIPSFRRGASKLSPCAGHIFHPIAPELES
ncbi:kinase-like domain-containing protein [Mycena filopes]|nr:kinase-like domain-containing protein [Mycena filopes]